MGARIRPHALDLHGRLLRESAVRDCPTVVTRKLGLIWRLRGENVPPRFKIGASDWDGAPRQGRVPKLEAAPQFIDWHDQSVQFHASSDRSRLYPLQVTFGAPPEAVFKDYIDPNRKQSEGVVGQGSLKSVARRFVTRIDAK